MFVGCKVSVFPVFIRVILFRKWVILFEMSELYTLWFNKTSIAE